MYDDDAPCLVQLPSGPTGSNYFLKREVIRNSMKMKDISVIMVLKKKIFYRILSRLAFSDTLMRIKSVYKAIKLEENETFLGVLVMPAPAFSIRMLLSPPAAAGFILKLTVAKVVFMFCGTGQKLPPTLYFNFLFCGELF